MDRFIELPSALVAYIALLFKIQYGQIYSFRPDLGACAVGAFKIQYGQIYRKKVIDDSFKYRNLKSNMDRFIA